MAVTLDSSGTQASSGTAVTSVNYSGITVGSPANPALIFLVSTSGGTSLTTSPSATWDSGGTNQAMTLLGSNTVTTHNGSIYIFGLRNPTPGTKTLAVSWTNSSQYAMCAISFGGVNQSSDAAAFPNAATNSGSSTQASQTVTSNTGDIALAIVQSNVTPSAPSNTQIYFDNAAQNDSGGQYATGAASVNFTWTITPADTWATIGVDVAQATTDVLMAQIWL